MLEKSFFNIGDNIDKLNVCRTELTHGRKGLPDNYYNNIAIMQLTVSKIVTELFLLFFLLGSKEDLILVNKISIIVNILHAKR